MAERKRQSRTRGWSEAHVERLFWRAGFGATSKEARFWSRRGKDATLKWLLDGGSAPHVRIPPPSLQGKKLDPANEYGHDVIWWLDQMVRSQRPLVEKMTLFWHDHFATTDQDTPLMLNQNAMFRRHALGGFRKLLGAVTTDPAMLLFLSLADSDKEQPNENYARELMELFTLGRGYSENDIRQAALALTGFRSSYENNQVRTYYDAEAHDDSVKTIFGKSGRFDWEAVLDLCITHTEHAGFMVGKLWDYFVGTELDTRTRKDLARIYRKSGLAIKPVVAAILAHKALYRRLDKPDMVKAPVVFVAGSLRAMREGVRNDAYVWLLDGMGQTLFRPPSVAGWEWGPTWLSTNSMHTRFDFASQLTRESRIAVKEGSISPRLSTRQAVKKARRAVGDPWTSPQTDSALERLAAGLLAERPPKPGVYRQRPQERADMCQRVLRHLLISGPDAQLH